MENQIWMLNFDCEFSRGRGVNYFDDNRSYKVSKIIYLPTETKNNNFKLYVRISIR